MAKGELDTETANRPQRTDQREARNHVLNLIHSCNKNSTEHISRTTVAYVALCLLLTIALLPLSKYQIPTQRWFFAMYTAGKRDRANRLSKFFVVVVVVQNGLLVLPIENCLGC